MSLTSSGGHPGSEGSEEHDDTSQSMVLGSLDDVHALTNWDPVPIDDRPSVACEPVVLIDVRRDVHPSARETLREAVDPRTDRVASSETPSRFNHLAVVGHCHVEKATSSTGPWLAPRQIVRF